FANTFQALDLEVAQTCLSITSPYANGNTFVSPYFNCPTPIFATAGTSNMLMNPSYGAAHAPAPGSQTGILTFPCRPRDLTAPPRRPPATHPGGPRPTPGSRSDGLSRALSRPADDRGSA